MRSRVVMVLMGLLVSSPLRVAAQAGEVEQGLRLGLDTDLVAHSEQTLALPADASFFARRNTTRTTSYGLAVPRVGIDLGFALPFMVLGVRASVLGSESNTASVTSSSSADTFSDALQYRVLAYGEGRFVLASPLALQVRGELGVIGGEQWLGDPDVLSAATHASVTFFSVGARIGLHIHPVGPFSISPYFGVAGLFGGGNIGELSDRTPRSGSIEGYELSFGVALFGWIPLGGAATPAVDERAEEEPFARPAVASSSAEPTHAGDNWSVAFDVPGAEARAWSDASTGAVQIALRTSSEAARFTDCAEALIANATARETLAVRVTTNRTLTGIDEELVMFGTQRHLEVLQADGGRLEICGYTIELPGGSRYALGRLLSRSRVAGPLPAPTPPPPPVMEPSPLVPVAEEPVESSAPASPEAAPPQ